MAAAAILSPMPAFAQITRVSSTDHKQSVGFTIGGFFPKGEDGRVEGDVVVADLDDLVFDISDLKGPSLSGEWLFALGNYLEAGVGVGYHQGRTSSVYRGFVNANNSEIEQELKLRVVPITGSVRFCPLDTEVLSRMSASALASSTGVGRSRASLSIPRMDRFSAIPIKPAAHQSAP
jgi:hypothetical protein